MWKKLPDFRAEKKAQDPVKKKAHKHMPQKGS